MRFVFARTLGAALILTATLAQAEPGTLGAAVFYDSSLGPTLSLNMDQSLGPRADLRFAIDGSEYQLGLKGNLTIAQAFGTDLTQGVLLNAYRLKNRPDIGQNLSYSGGELSTRFGKTLDDGASWNFGLGAQHLAIDLGSTLPMAISDYVAAHGARLNGGFVQIQAALDRVQDGQRGGYRLAAHVELGQMGRDTYGKFTLSGDMFTPLGAAATLHSRARLGRGFGLYGADFPLFKNFTAGGATDLRGYGLGGIGPVSGFARGDDLAHIGGDTALTAGVEIVRALGETTSLISFVDAAAVHDGGDFLADMRSSVGLGLRWNSPIGPFDLSLARALNPKSTDIIAPVQVTFGVTF